MEKYYLHLNYTPKHLIETMYTEARCVENYYLSPVGVWRCDVSQYLRDELAKIINVPFADCGFLKTPPTKTYPVHVDAFRITAINMPIFGDTWGFESGFVVDDKLNLINYRTNYLTMLNVMEPHTVINKNTVKARVVLSIGFRNHSYETMKELFHAGNLLNVTL